MSMLQNIGSKVGAAIVAEKAKATTNSTDLENTKVAAIQALNTLSANEFAAFDTAFSNLDSAKQDAIQGSYDDGIAALVKLVYGEDADGADAIDELLALLAANNGDWIATLAAKKSDLDAELATHEATMGDYAEFTAQFAGGDAE